MKANTLKPVSQGNLKESILKNIKAMTADSIYMAMLKGFKGDEKAVKHCIDWSISENMNK